MSVTRFPPRMGPRRNLGAGDLAHPTHAELLRREMLEEVMGRAEDAYFKLTGRTRYQLAIDLVECLVDRMVMMDREDLGKRYLLAVADEMERRDGDKAARARAAHSAALRKELLTSIAALPHRRERGPETRQ